MSTYAALERDIENEIDTYWTTGEFRTVGGRRVRALSMLRPWFSVDQTPDEAYERARLFAHIARYVGLVEVEK